MEHKMDYKKLNPNVTLNEEDFKHVENLLITAFEGGSNYWYLISDHNRKHFPKDVYLSSILAHPGSRMVIKDGSGEEYFEPKEITHEDVLTAWEAFQQPDDRWKRHFRDLISGNDDACTGDAFLQLVVLNDIVFG
jgi:hypothetical protein